MHILIAGEVPPIHGTDDFAAGYDIEFDLPAPVAVVTLLNVHPSRVADLRSPDELCVEPALPTESFLDSFGNRCVRFVAQTGNLRLSNSLQVYDPGLLDAISPGAREVPVAELPHEALRYLYNSRYCEVDRFSALALELFGGITPGWGRVRAVCDWVHSKVKFGYQYARPTKRLWMCSRSGLEYAGISSIWR